MTRLTLRIDFESGGAFGPGKARLLELIAEKTSLRQAAAAMDMSYRHAWLLIQAAEESFGAPLVETETGGSRGGGSRLTALGKEVVARYRAAEKKATAGAKAEMAALAKLAVSSRPQAPRRRLKPRKKA